MARAHCAVLAVATVILSSGELSRAAAQSATPPPTAAEPQRRWVMPAAGTERAAPVPADDVDLAGNVWLEIAGGVIGAVIAGAALAGGFFLATNSDDGDCTGACIPLIAGGVIGLFVAPAAGVTLAGDASGGQGNFGISLLGTLPGLLVGPVGMVVGAVAGYRMSAPDSPPAGAQPHARGAVMLIDLRF